MKPPVKERTEPVDLVLHSDVRAVGRAEFDQKVSLLKKSLYIAYGVKPYFSGTSVIPISFY